MQTGGGVWEKTVENLQNDADFLMGNLHFCKKSGDGMQRKNAG